MVEPDRLLQGPPSVVDLKRPKVMGEVEAQLKHQLSLCDAVVKESNKPLPHLHLLEVPNNLQPARLSLRLHASTTHQVHQVSLL